MTPWFWLFVWTVCILGSIVAHEAAHVVVGVRSGWNYHGMFFHPKSLGIGVNLDPSSPAMERSGLWKIGLAGPVASLFLAEMFWAASTLNTTASHWLFNVALFNLIVAGMNLVPTPITDGGHIVKGLFGWTIKWRYLIAFWAIAELVALYFLW